MRPTRESDILYILYECEG